MKSLRLYFVAMSLLIIIAGCSNNLAEPENTAVEKTLFVGPERVDCVGVAPQQCYKVKDNPTDEWRFFYNEVAGFEYEPGYEYELRVREETVANPPADGSSLRWELIEIVSKEAVQSTPTPDPSLEATVAAPTPVPTREPAWSFSTNEEIWSSPTVHDGVVYFGSDDKHLYAVDIETQQLIWKFETGHNVRSRPSVTNDSVYFTSDDGFLYALAKDTGEQLWSLDIGNSAIERRALNDGWDYLLSSPVGADGMLYVGSANGNLYAVDTQTGQEKWTFSTDSDLPIRSTPNVKDGVVYFGSWSGYVYAVDAETGLEIWQHNVLGSVQSSPFVTDDMVYIGSRDTHLHALDAKTGERIWRFRFVDNYSWVESSPTLVNGVIYVGSSDARRLYALDATTGEKLWDFQTDGYAWSSPVVENELVYIGAKGGVLYAIDTNTGEAQWKIKVADGIVSSPAIAGDFVYFTSLDGNLYAASIVP